MVIVTIDTGSGTTSRTSCSVPERTVTVVICAYTERRWPQLRKAVDSVLRQELPPNQIVLVIDHNPGLLQRARAAYPQLTVVANTDPRGLSGARNTGVSLARGDIVAFLDDDAVAEPDWLARILTHYDDQRVLAVGGSAVPDWEGRRPRWLPPEFDWVVGCSFTGQPSTTAELCIRLRQRRPDGVVLYDPAAAVRHRVTSDRGTWAYFRRRCFSEGRSKAVVARLVGTDAGLATERVYTRHVLPSGVWRGLLEARARRDLGGLARSGAIVVGLLVTASGYASYRMGTARRGACCRWSCRTGSPPSPPAPARTARRTPPPRSWCGCTISPSG